MAPFPVSSNHYLVILCGGTGPRLWPLSTATKPKQFLAIGSSATLLEQTVNRARKIVSPSHIYIVTNLRYRRQVTALKLRLPPSNILYEPEKRNTLLAIIYATAIINRRHPHAIITTFPADHFIQKNLHFKRDIQKATKLAAASGSFVLIGIKPTWPNPSFGYLRLKKTLPGIYTVAKFKEKPSSVLAKKYLATNHYYWNSGIYSFSSAALGTALQLYQPQFYQALLQLTHSSLNLKKIYQSLPAFAFDYAISEKSQNLVALKASFDWSDVGEWGSIFTALARNHKMVNLNPSAPHLEIASKNCLIYGQKNKLISLIGVNNLAIIDTPRGLLVCRLDQASHVRDLVATMVADNQLQDFFLK